MTFFPPVGQAYCAVCSKKIAKGSIIGFLTDKKGYLKLAHINCKEKP
jgi:hypothetical protein